MKRADIILEAKFSTVAWGLGNRGIRYQITRFSEGRKREKTRSAVVGRRGAGDVGVMPATRLRGAREDQGRRGPR